MDEKQIIEIMRAKKIETKRRVDEQLKLKSSGKLTPIELKTLDDETAKFAESWKPIIQQAISILGSKYNKINEALNKEVGL